MRTLGRWVRLAGLVLAGAAVPEAMAAPSGQAFVRGVNDARAREGLEPLRSHWDLQDDADRHAASMAASGRITRFPDLEAVTSGWTVLAEYQARGDDVAQLMHGAMASPRHRDQLMGTYDRIGVGLRSGPGGELYLAVVLMRSAE